MAAERNRALVQLFLRELSEDRAKVAFDLVAGNALVHDVSRDSAHGRDDARDRAVALRRAFPDLRHEVVATVVDGSKVGVRCLLRGTHGGPYGGIPATGRTIAVPMASIFRVGDARIAEWWSVRDERGLFRQLGLLPGSSLPTSDRPPPPDAPQPPAGAGSAATTRSVIERFYADVLDRGALELLGELAEPSVLDDSPPPFPRCTNREQLAEAVRVLRASVEPLRVELRDLLVQGDRAFAYVTYRGDSRGPLLGLPPTGRRVSWNALELLDVRGGKLAARSSVFDALGIVTQLEEPASRAAGTMRLPAIDDD